MIAQPWAVASPFAKATALVSVHGEGVLDAFVTELEGPQSVVEVPIRRNYAPTVHRFGAGRAGP